MSKDEINEIKKELEEQKKRNEEMSKILKEVYKKLEVPLEPKSKAEEQLENDVSELKDRKPRIHREPIRPRAPRAPKAPRVPKAPRIPSKPIQPEFHFDFNSEEFKKKIEDIKNKVEKATTEGMKTAKDISIKISKDLGKLLEKETARITKASKISKEELNEINSEIDVARNKIGSYQHEIDSARHRLRQAREEVRSAQRRIERARSHGDSDERKEAEESLQDSIESLNDAEEDIRDSRSDLAQSKREFARLQRRAGRIHSAQKGKSPPHVIRIGDADVDSTMSEYITKVMDSVGKSLENTFRTTFEGGVKAPLKAIRHATRAAVKGRHVTTSKVYEDNNSIEEVDEFYDKASALLSALGDDNRLKILKILEDSPQYQKELAEDTGLRGGTFKHHTDILQDVDFITREAIRGRYLITQLGIEAIKLAEMIYLRKKRTEEEDEAINIDIED